ncbi:MAG TPA: helix-turn-helix domain-containing protein [Solirubrobacterales bacterium]|nr:helix-turn-helix domain-containing protein [Solirubrobacterales bacterium]
MPDVDGGTEVDPHLRKVFAQAVRAEILERIGKRPSSPRQLAEATGEPLGTMTYHVAVLHRAGCIRPVGPDDGGDPGERVYEVASLGAEPPRLPLSDAIRDRAISSILRRIVEQGRAALAAGTLGADATRLSCVSVLLDEQGLREAQAILDEAAARLAATRSASAKRLNESRVKGVRTTIALAGFESPSEEKPSRR